MKIAFFGTGEFSLSILKVLHEQQREIIVELIVSQPDKPVGRKQIFTPPPVIKYAQSHHLESLQPNKIKTNKEVFDVLLKKELDCIVVVAYGKIIPKEILELPKYGSVNIHGSLLPKYRGASPVQESLKHGDETVGFTIMKMSEGMDEGEILSLHPISILPTDTAQEVFEKFSKHAPDALVHELQSLINNQAHPIAQNHSEATYCTKISKEDGRIFFSKQSGLEIYSLYRAYKLWPGIYSEYIGKKIQFTDVSFEKNSLCLGDEFRIGDVVEYEYENTKHIALLTSDGLLILHKIKLEGKKEMDIVSFVRGNQGFLNAHFE